MRHPQAQNKFNVVYSIWQKNYFCVYDILVAMPTRLFSFVEGRRVSTIITLTCSSYHFIQASSLPSSNMQKFDGVASHFLPILSHHILLVEMCNLMIRCDSILPFLFLRQITEQTKRSPAL
jgi:hypothetical protein